MPLLVVAVLHVACVVVTLELEKPFPDPDVPGLMVKALGLETNGLTYAPLDWRVSGTTYCGCRARSSRIRRRRGCVELGLSPPLGLIHDLGEEQFDVRRAAPKWIRPGPCDARCPQASVRTSA
jgi:hypothetical protein